jgi:hypothetical protein
MSEILLNKRNDIREDSVVVFINKLLYITGYSKLKYSEEVLDVDTWNCEAVNEKT